MPFFDTNILVYAQDPDEPGKRAIARQLIDDAIARDAFMVSTQVLLEFYATMLRRRMLTPAAALALVRAWAEQEVVTATPDLLVRGFELQQNHSLSVWDALIVQAALDAGCHTLLTEDLQTGRRFGALEVVNPFAPGAHERSPAHAAPAPAAPALRKVKRPSARR